MNQAEFASKISVEMLDARVGSYCTITKFDELDRKCKEFALSKDLKSTNVFANYTKNSLSNYVL